MSTMTDYPRNIPCTACGRDVTVYQIERSGSRPGQTMARPPQMNYLHSEDRPGAGPHGGVDDKCTKDPLS